MTVYNYRKSEQIEKYIGQFMRVFSGFQVQDGVQRNGEYLTKRVPVVYGNMSRIVASILTKRDHLTNARIPVLAANMSGLEPDPQNKKSPHHRDERSTRITADYPVSMIDRITGPAFNMNMELSVYASSTTEMFDIVEQILLVFNPRVSIQKSTDIYDSNYITDVILTGIQPEISYPMGTDQSVVSMTLLFSVPIRLNYPQGVSDNIIAQIISNVKTNINNDEDLADVETTTITGDLVTGTTTTTRV